MTIADTSRARILYAREITWGETPASPDMTELRLTGESLTHDKETATSGEIRSDRMRSGVFETGASASGSIDFELTFGSFDTLLEGALQNSIVETTLSGIGLDFDTSMITAEFSSNWTGYEAGQWIKISGATNTENNGIFQINDITNEVATLNTSSLITETTTGAVITGNRLRNGTTAQSFVFEKQFQDVSEYISLTGLRVDTFSLDISTNSIVTGSFGFQGKGAVSAASSISGSIAAPNSNKPFSSNVNVGALQEGGVDLTTTIQSLSLSLSNNLRTQAALGSKNVSGIGSGSIDLTGSLTAYFEDNGLYQKFLEHTETSLSFRLTDVNQNVMIFTIPKIQFTAGNPVAEGPDQDVLLPVEFTAIRDDVSNAVLLIDLL